jgi:signal peptidase
MKKIGTLINIVVGFIFLAILLLIFVSYFNNPLKLRLYGIASQSMYPALRKNDLIMVMHKNNYKKGDIITFFNPKGARKSDTVTHRIGEIIKEKGRVLFKTKGDANSEPDDWNVGESNVIGATIYRLPFFGYIISASKTPFGFVLLVLFPAFILLYIEMQNIRNEMSNLFKSKGHEKNSR